MCATPAALAQDPLSEPLPSVLPLARLNGANGFLMAGPRGNFAEELAPAGDLNGDGIDDLVLSAWTSNTVYVLFGLDTPAGGGAFPTPIDLTELDPGESLRLDGDVSEFAGCSVAGVGDINGDGIDDLAIGARAALVDGEFQAGVAYVVFGRDASGGNPFPATIELRNLDGTDGFRVEGFGRFHLAGDAVAPAGDLNNDGFDDVAIGAPGALSAFVVFGRDTSASGPFPAVRSLSTLDGTDGVRFVGDRGRPGSTLAALGDINGDGTDDLAIGDPFARDPDAGYVGETIVVFGRDAAAGGFGARVELATLRDAEHVRLPGFDGLSGLGLAGGGDVNGDGLNDLAIGDPYVSEGPGLFGGETYLIYGSRDLGGTIELGTLEPPDGVRMRGGQARLYSGAALAMADLNGDGLDDLAIGAPGTLLPPYSYGRTGRSYVVFGRSDLPAQLDLFGYVDPETGVVLTGVGPDDRSGQALAAAGDVNADGRPDLLVGAPGASSDTGEAYLVYGRSCRADLDGDGELTIFDFLAFQNLFDAGSSRADFDGDGELTIFDFLAFQNAFDAGCA